MLQTFWRNFLVYRPSRNDNTELKKENMNHTETALLEKFRINHLLFSIGGLLEYRSYLTNNMPKELRMRRV